MKCQYCGRDLSGTDEYRALYDALAALVHLHGCEQEGVESGMPTPDQWEQAVNNAVIALKGARSES